MKLVPGAQAICEVFFACTSCWPYLWWPHLQVGGAGTACLASALLLLNPSTALLPGLIVNLRNICGKKRVKVCKIIEERLRSGWEEAICAQRAGTETRQLGGRVRGKGALCAVRRYYC